MTVPRLVIFGCDGVLVDSVGISCEVLARSLTAAGLPITPEEALRDFRELLLAEVVSRVEERLGRALPVDWVERYEREREMAFSLDLRPVRGAAEAVRRIRAAGVAVCVASQGKVEKTRLSLNLTGLRGLFPENGIFSADEVLRPKPQPDLLLHAARSMKVPPAHCVVVEDMPSGVQAAVSAGMRAFGYAPGTEGRPRRGASATDERALGYAPVTDEPVMGDATELALREAGAAEVFRSLEKLPALLGLPD
jgi:HAD superfamily hydrolase (TIGR01509 family)